jgi:hypothetical protein
MGSAIGAGRALCLDPVLVFGPSIATTVLAIVACHLAMLLARLYNADYSSWGSFMVHPSKCCFPLFMGMLGASCSWPSVLGQSQIPRCPSAGAQVLSHSAPGVCALQKCLWSSGMLTAEYRGCGLSCVRCGLVLFWP